MCAVIRWRGQEVRINQRVQVVRAKEVLTGIWVGFAREEILNWWLKCGYEEVDLLAEEFAERSRQTGKLVWGEVEDGHVLRAIFGMECHQRLVRLVTRACTEEELARFGHHRMPLVGPLRFGTGLDLAEVGIGVGTGARQLSFDFFEQKNLGY